MCVAKFHRTWYKAGSAHHIKTSSTKPTPIKIIWQPIRLN